MIHGLTSTKYANLCFFRHPYPTLVCTLACLIKVRTLIKVREGLHIKINKRPVLNKDVQEGQISKKNKRPGAL